MAKADARARAAARKGQSQSTPAERDPATEQVDDDLPAAAPARPAGTASSTANRAASTASRPASTTRRAASMAQRSAPVVANGGSGRRDTGSGGRVGGRRDGGALGPLIVPRWLPITSLALVVIGLALSVYLTYEHYTASATLACSDNGVVNCLQVTTSAQSKVFGIPVALLGLVYFVAMLPACLPAAWRSRSPWLRNGRIAAGIVGIGFVFYLLYAELFTIGKICLYCTGVHVVTVALFAVVLFGQASVTAPEDR
jgi:uncharacterized membrane protein